MALIALPFAFVHQKGFFLGLARRFSRHFEEHLTAAENRLHAQKGILAWCLEGR